MRAFDSHLFYRTYDGPRSHLIAKVMKIAAFALERLHLGIDISFIRAEGIKNTKKHTVRSDRLQTVQNACTPLIIQSARLNGN